MRYYNNKVQSESIHIVGNGFFMAAVKGLDIPAVKAGMSGGILFSLQCTDARSVEAESERIKEKTEWLYSIYLDGKKIGSMREYATEGAFVREFDLSQRIEFTILTGADVKKEKGRFVLPAGVVYVNDYATAESVYFSFTGIQADETENSIVFHAEKCVFRVLIADEAERLSDCGNAITYLPPKSPFQTKYAEETEDYYQVVKSCTARNGAIVGFDWNLCYLRDNFGAHRAFLEMGDFDSAKALLRFYNEIYQKFGCLHTAQSAGKDGTFHIHECDDVEGTGYLILQGTEYLERTGDTTFFEEILPMLRWAFYAQLGRCRNGMLPFNGDETYVACGLFPRTQLENGSAESTMLFIQSGIKLLPYLKDGKAEKVVADASAHFKEHFLCEGEFVINNPSRPKEPYDKKRKGVCVWCGCYTDGLAPDRYGYYACPNCMNRGRKVNADERYRLSCVSMLPAYLGSGIFSEQELTALYETAAERILDKNRTERITGYECGLLLYGLCRIRSSRYDEAVRFALANRDEEGAWAEYYDGNKPAGMRWRVWEGGVTLAALLHGEKARR